MDPAALADFYAKLLGRKSPAQQQLMPHLNFSMEKAKLLEWTAFAVKLGEKRPNGNLANGPSYWTRQGIPSVLTFCKRNAEKNKEPDCKKT